MKKFVYSLIFILFLFIGINDVSAKSVTKVCYYKSDDNKLNVAVKVYDDGTSKAFLIKSYYKSDGFIEAQSYGAGNWTVNQWSTNSNCATYLKYGINTGTLRKNVVTASSSKPSTGKNEYVLSNYSLKSTAYVCEYSPVEKQAYDNIKLKVMINPSGALVAYFNDNENSILDNNLMSPSGKFFVQTNKNFATEFASQFLKNNVYNCPTVSAPASDTQIQVSVGLLDGSVIKFNNTLSKTPSGGEISESEHGISDKNLYTANFIDVAGANKQIITVDFFIDKGINYIKLKVGDLEKSAEEVVMKGDFYQTTVNSNLYFRIYANQVNKLFSTDGQNKIEPKTVYLNKLDISGSGTYYFELSTEKSNDSVSSDEGNNFTGVLSGARYNDLTCRLYPLLKANENYSSSLEGNLIDFTGCSGNYVGSAEELNYHTVTAVKNMANYCNDLYTGYNKFKQDDRVFNRIDECVNFDTFYNKMVQNAVINNLSSDCPFISGALKDKITWVLNIIKIAAPIIAIGLGSLDFIKVILSGEADKEMKNAGKKFMKRFIAAMLLFIAPVLLAWFMDLTLEDEKVKENPFCGTVDWSTIK